MDEINWQCYKQGFDAWDNYVESNWIKKMINPHQADTTEWRRWNRGWNINENGLNAPGNDPGRK